MSDQTSVMAPKKGTRNRKLPQEDIVQYYTDHVGEKGLVPDLAEKYDTTEQAIYAILRTHGLRKRIPISVIQKQQKTHNDQIMALLLEMIQNSPLSDEAIDYLKDNKARFFFHFEDGGDTK